MDNPLQPPPSITYCVVNYNGECYLEKSLEALSRQKRAIDEILLIDNGSTDLGVELAKKVCPDVQIILLEENRGPGVARNTGLQKAGNDFIVFLDNDVQLQANCALELIEALQGNPQAVAAAPRVLYAKHKDIIQYEGADSHYLGLMVPGNANARLVDCSMKVRKINSLVTACFLLHRVRWGAKELFDDSFFFNYEDHDFGMRARVIGHELLAVPAARVLHEGGTAGLSWRPGTEYSKTRIYCLIRNRWQVILKNYSLKSIILLSPCFFIYEIFQLAGIAKKGWIREWLRAFLWIIANSRRILERRSCIQQARICPDREILEDGPLPFTGDLHTTRVERAAKELLDKFVNGYWIIVRRFI